METTGLIVVRDDRVAFERYWLGNDATTQSIAWSVSKSFVSALIGIAVGEGAIASVEDPVTRYAPELAGGAYDGVRLKDVLQMSSGARWNEDYSDPNSDIDAYGRVMSGGGSLDAFAAGPVRERPPGTFNRYNSTDTHVLGLVLRRRDEALVDRVPAREAVAAAGRGGRRVLDGRHRPASRWPAAASTRCFATTPGWAAAI